MSRTQQLQQVRELVWRDMPRKQYHNPEHAEDVSQTAGRFARLMDFDKRLVHLLETAGLYHDVVHGAGKDNEEQSAAYGAQHLPSLGYQPWEIEFMGDLIVHGTKMPQKPRNLFEKVLADADIYNAGRDDFLLRNEQLRQELGAQETIAWYERSKEFLETICWWTEPARRYGEEGRLRNIRLLEEKIAQHQRHLGGAHYGMENVFA